LFGEAVAPARSFVVLSIMPKHILAAAAAAAAVVLSGCGGAGEATGGSTAEAKAAAPEPQAEPPAAGQWRRSLLGGSGVLAFGPSRGRPLAALRCDAQLESMLIERMTDQPGAGDTMKVKAGGETERLPVMWNGASLPVATATLRLEDPLTDRLAGLGQPIELELKGAAKLSLPPDRRIGTLIEECRQT